jgi:hypothetical protein
LQRTPDAGLFIGSGFDQIEVWRAPWSELPTQHAFVKLAGAVNIICVNSKVL